MVPGGDLKFTLSAEAPIDFANIVSLSFTRSLGSHGPEDNAEEFEFFKQGLYKSLRDAVSERNWVLERMSDTDYKLFCSKVQPFLFCHSVTS